MSNDFQQSVGSAVQAALSESLPQELAGPQLAAALEASLGSQLRQALVRPLQDSFTAAFQHQLMPAFEGACRDMFAQVGSLSDACSPMPAPQPISRAFKCLPVCVLSCCSPLQPPQPNSSFSV